MISSRHFTHCVLQKTLVSEISMLRGQSIDNEISLESVKTGLITKWTLTDKRTCAEGEIIAWIYTPTTETLEKTPMVSGYTLHILND